MAENTLELTINIAAPVETVWKEVVDWQGQTRWMLQTSVWNKQSGPTPTDVEIFAFTGPLHFIYPRFKYLGVLDHMKVTHWQPPYRCDVIHIGKVIKGTGTFQLSERTATSTHFYWSETIRAPRAIFFLVRPFFYVGVWISLRSLARLIRSNAKHKVGE